MAIPFQTVCASLSSQQRLTDDLSGQTTYPQQPELSPGTDGGHPTPSSAESEATDIDVCAKVYPLGEVGHLPADLELQVLDQAGIAVMQAQARETASIQVNFSGKVGETFSIRLRLKTEYWMETFIL
jgi:hypothetical protein